MFFFAKRVFSFSCLGPASIVPRLQCTRKLWRGNSAGQLPIWRFHEHIIRAARSHQLFSRAVPEGFALTNEVRM